LLLALKPATPRDQWWLGQARSQRLGLRKKIPPIFRGFLARLGCLCRLPICHQKCLPTGHIFALGAS
jgi:hypothetical protein